MSSVVPSGAINTGTATIGASYSGIATETGELVAGAIDGDAVAGDDDTVLVGVDDNVGI
ncbi:MAG: hypothetical protein ACYCW5_04625 [Thermoleophilia bacterium]